MNSMALALPIKDKEAGMRAIEEVMKNKSDILHNQRLAQGFKRTKVFYQTKPQEMVIFYIEGDNVLDAISKRHDDDHEFEKYLDDVVQKVTGHSLRELHVGDHPVQLLLDWHEEKGVAASHR
jgi:hypothetical protein